LLDDALDLATVDVQVAGYGTLAMARLVPVANRTLQTRDLRHYQRYVATGLWYRLRNHVRGHLVHDGPAG
jgi:hypothetical protein